MNEGWIKLHRKLLRSEIWGDITACRVLVWLLLKVDRNNGKLKLGRKWASKECNLKETTFYGALLRLQKRFKIINIVTNKMTIKYTEIEVKKWYLYQNSDKGSDNQLTINRQSTDNQLTHYKNKEVRIKNKEYSNVEVQRTYDLYIKEFSKNKNQYRLTDKRKQRLKSRLKDAGMEMLEKAIKNTAGSSFHRGDNDRGWQADLDFIIRSYEQVERLANMDTKKQKNETQEDLKKEYYKQQGIL